MARSSRDRSSQERSSASGGKTGSAQLAELIRKRREQLGLTRQELADATGIPYPTVAQIETAYRGVSPARLGIIARAIGLDPKELYDVLASETPPEPAEPAAGAAGTSGRSRPVPGGSWYANPGFAAPLAASHTPAAEHPSMSSPAVPHAPSPPPARPTPTAGSAKATAGSDAAEPERDASVPIVGRAVAGRARTTRAQSVAHSPAPPAVGSPIPRAAADVAGPSGSADSAAVVEMVVDLLSGLPAQLRLDALSQVQRQLLSDLVDEQVQRRRGPA